MREPSVHALSARMSRAGGSHGSRPRVLAREGRFAAAPRIAPVRDGVELARWWISGFRCHAYPAPRAASTKSERERKGIMRTSRARLNAAALLLASIAIFGAGEAAAQVPPLSSVPVPGPSPTDLAKFIRTEPAAQQALRVLGKALLLGHAGGQRRRAGVRAPATSGPERIPGRRTRSAQACSGSCSSLTRTATLRRSRLPTATSPGRARTPRSPQATSRSGSSRIPTNRESAIAVGHEQRRVLAGRAPRDLRPGRPARPRTPTASTSGKAASAATFAASSRATRRR